MSTEGEVKCDMFAHMLFRVMTKKKSWNFGLGLGLAMMLLRPFFVPLYGTEIKKMGHYSNHSVMDLSKAHWVWQTRAG